MNINTKISCFLGSLAGLFLGVGSIFPDKLLTPIFASLAGLFLLIIFVKSGAPVRSLLCSGVIFHVIAMWWIGPTVQRFGGFGYFSAFIILVLYVFSSSIQFALLGYLRRFFSGDLGLVFGFLTCWISLELFFPRLFPWGFGHFFIAFSPLSSHAEWLGLHGVSFLALGMIASAYFLYLKCIAGFSVSRGASILLMSLVLIFASGFYLDANAKRTEAGAAKAEILVVQGNLSLEAKGKEQFFYANIESYRRLTQDVLTGLGDRNLDLVIWPETVVSEWVDLQPPITSPTMSKVYSTFKPQVPILYGGLGFERTGFRSANYFNSAFIQENENEISQFYGKRTLMPFGEYIPFVEIFPWLKQIVPIGDGFTPGGVESPLVVKTASGELRIGVLICYEDIVYGHALSYALQGANLLVNLTNDAWYGDTSAPWQHDLLARFRAIENRKYLIRSTNTGATTLTDSTGKIITAFPLFSEQSRVLKVPLLEDVTVFSRTGYFYFYAIIGALFFFGLWESKRFRKTIIKA